jgi:ABC-2 type transport system permease protein
MRTLLTLALKDLRVLVRDRMALFWALGFPVLFALFFGSIMKAGAELDAPSVSVALVSESATPPDYLVRLELAMREAGLRVALHSRQDAERAVQRGEAALSIDVPDPTSWQALRIGVDPARRSEASYATAVLRAVLITALAKEAPVLPPFETRVVTGAGRGPASGFALVFPAMIVWGLLGCAAAFSVALVSERASGTLVRLYAAPLSRVSLVAGKALACALACAASVLLLSAVGVLGLSVAIDDVLKYTVAALAAIACFVGLTQALSVLGNTEQSVAGAGWSTLIVLAMCGGAMVPEVLMPSWLVTLSALSPVRWAIVALEGAMWRASSWAELWAPIASLCALGIATFGLGALVLRVREAG